VSVWFFLAKFRFVCPKHSYPARDHYQLILNWGRLGRHGNRGMLGVPGPWFPGIVESVVTWECGMLGVPCGLLE
jgi:hypothetical protein